MQHATRTTGERPGRLRPALPRGLVWLAALTIAVLNPLACVIHCAAMDSRAHRAHESASPAEIFLCDITSAVGAAPAAGPGALQLPAAPAAGAPRAVYDGVVFAALALAPILLLISSARAADASLRSIARTPATPPPR